jgi:hypothetical protein
MAVPRTWTLILKAGEYAVNLGNGRAQGLLEGDPRGFTKHDDRRAISDSDFAGLKNNARVEGYDPAAVYLRPLPEPPLRTID